MGFFTVSPLNPGPCHVGWPQDKAAQGKLTVCKQTCWKRVFKKTEFNGEPERFTRWIKEAIHIRKEGQQAMNRDEASYQLSHAYDCFLDTASSRRVKHRKNWVPASPDEGLS